MDINVMVMGGEPGHQWVFQQVNNPKKTAKLVLELIKQPNIKLLEWSSQSPDLNTIENLWTMLKSQLSRKPTHLNEFHQFCQEVSNILPDLR